jgi:alpha-1,2-mannosyltransferase
MRIVALWRRCSPAARGLALFAAANVLVLGLALPLALGTSRAETGLAETYWFFHLEPLEPSDSWWPMFAAVHCLREKPDQLLYTTLFFGWKTKFQYPPTSLLIVYHALAVCSGIGLMHALTVLSWLLVFATAGFAAAVLVRSLPERATPTGRDRALFAAVGVGLALTYYPVVRAFWLGQIQVWINAFFAALVWAWMGQRKKTCGVLAGLMCLIKPQYGVLLLWGALRRQWSFVLAAAAAGGVGLAFSVWQFGLANHVDYLPVLSFIARHGESFYANQSVNGLLHHLLGNGDSLGWDPHGFAPFHPLVYAGTTAASLALLGIALFGPLRRRAPGSVLDLGAAALACTLASPVAWEHHYGILLPVYAVLFADLYRTGRRMGLVALAVSYALTSNFFAGLNRFAATPYNFLQSYVLFGGLIALGLLLLRQGVREEVPQA